MGITIHIIPLRITILITHTTAITVIQRSDMDFLCPLVGAGAGDIHHIDSMIHFIPFIPVVFITEAIPLITAMDMATTITFT